MFVKLIKILITFNEMGLILKSGWVVFYIFVQKEFKSKNFKQSDVCDKF